MHDTKTSVNPYEQPDARWGAASTILWTILMVAIWQGLIASWVAYRAQAMGISIDTEGWLSNPDLAADLMNAVVVGGICCILMVFGVVWLKKDSRMWAYLPFAKVSPIEFLKWLGLATLVVLVSGMLSRAFGLEESKDMNQVLTGMQSAFMMYVAIVLAAPIAEELIFRGFVISGFERLKIVDAASIAVALSAFMWALLHVQYHAHEMFQLFLLGLVLGFARLKTKSILTPMLIHLVNNLVAVLTVAM